MSDVKLSPTRLAALRLVAGGNVQAYSTDTPTPWFTNRTPGLGRFGGDLVSTPYRWLVAHGLAAMATTPSGYGDQTFLVLTPAGEAFLAAHSAPEETR